MINFKFKGKRTYAHGSDIYNKMIDMVRNFAGQYPKSVKGSFHFLLQNKGIFRVYESGVSESVEKFAAIFSINMRGKKAYQVVLIDAGTPISSSYEYDERDVLKNMDLKNKIITLPFNASYTYIEQFVAMTKKLHMTIYPEAKGKWLFTKIHINDAINNDIYAGKVLGVQSERNMQYKLTQCSLKLDGQLIGHIFFSLVPQKEFK
jgi:hypothetical protein